VAGATYPLEDEQLLLIKTAVGDTATYQNVGGTPVMRISLDYATSTWKRVLMLQAWPTFSAALNWRMSGKAYFDGDYWLGHSVNPAGDMGYLFGLVVADPVADRGTVLQGYSTAPVTNWLNPPIEDIERTWVIPGWVEWMFEFHADGTWRSKGWQPEFEDEPTEWHNTQSDMTFFPTESFTYQLQPAAVAVGANMDIAYLQMEELLI
jgi:hypothetical protein